MLVTIKGHAAAPVSGKINGVCQVQLSRDPKHTVPAMVGKGKQRKLNVVRALVISGSMEVELESGEKRKMKLLRLQGDTPHLWYSAECFCRA